MGRQAQSADGWEGVVWDGDNDHVHVVPVNDLLQHNDRGTDDCICGPQTVPIERLDGTIGWMYVHASLDGREQHEK